MLWGGLGGWCGSVVCVVKSPQERVGKNAYMMHGLLPDSLSWDFLTFTYVLDQHIYHSLCGLERYGCVRGKFKGVQRANFSRQTYTTKYSTDEVYQSVSTVLHTTGSLANQHAWMSPRSAALVRSIQYGVTSTHGTSIYTPGGVVRFDRLSVQDLFN